MSWPIVADISNYDYDEDLDEPLWPSKFIAAGISSIIIGSQWPYKAEAQLRAAQAAGLRILGTYAEPDVASAIALAHMAGCAYVGLACERGSILTFSELSADVDAVRGAGLTPWVYGNAGDLISIARPLLATELIWLANYGMNDPANPRDPITEYNFPGVGVRRLAAHQFSSTIVVAGRNRDHSYLYLEEPMTAEERKEHEDMLLAMFSGGEEQSLPRADRLVNARYRLSQRIDGDIDGNHSPSFADAIASHALDKAAHRGN